MIESTLATRPTPKRLILSLLSAPTMENVEIGHLIEWGGLFDIEAAATRVAVGRLVKQGFIESVARGTYSIGPQGRLMAKTASSWMEAEQRVRPWSGGWILVHSSHLGRTNKTALRARERAFRLNGFVECVAGLWLRPANFAESLTQTRDSLLALGLESAAVVSVASELAGVDEHDLFGLWPRHDIESAYNRHRDAMHRSASRLDTLSLAEAARETIIVGEAVIRQINADPLLPEPMIDIASRHAMIAQMLDYDTLGREIWRRYIAQIC